MLGTDGEVRMNSRVTFCYGLLLMDTPGLADQQRLWYICSVEGTRCSLEDVPAVIDDKDRWLERVMGPSNVRTTWWWWWRWWWLHLSLKIIGSTDYIRQNTHTHTHTHTHKYIYICIYIYIYRYIIQRPVNRGWERFYFQIFFLQYLCNSKSKRELNLKY